jgi:hypothetical protein
LFLLAAALGITSFSPLGILQVIPYAKNDPLRQLMRQTASAFPFQKSRAKPRS